MGSLGRKQLVYDAVLTSYYVVGSCFENVIVNGVVSF